MARGEGMNRSFLLIISFVWIGVGMAEIFYGRDATACIIISQVWLAASLINKE